MGDLTLFHTAQVHCATFDALAPKADLDHVVREDWLERAQDGIDAALRVEIEAAIHATDGPVLCTCTTIGPVAEAAGATRIDWPMMQEAAQIGGPVLMAFCLQSTRAPSEALLRRAFGTSDPQLRLLDLGEHWELFAQGETHDFAEAIASDVLAVLDVEPAACVVLAQASMSGAAPIVQNATSAPVLSSPGLAIQAMLDRGVAPNGHS